MTNASLYSLSKKYKTLPYLLLFGFILVTGYNVCSFYFQCYFSDWNKVIVTKNSIGLFLSEVNAFLGSKLIFEVIFGCFLFNKIRKTHIKIINLIDIKKYPTVAIVVPIKNDFSKNNTLSSFEQDYKGKIIRYIVDDSTDETVINEIKKFAQKNNVIVLHTGDWKKNYYKKGCNLARAFDYFVSHTNKQWDFMVHLDSGDFLPSDYVSKTIPFFYYDQNLGSCIAIPKPIMQNSVFANEFNFIQSDFYSPVHLIDSTITNSFLSGAGCVYKKEALLEINAWPNYMCEDTTVSQSIINARYNTLVTNTTYVGCLAVNDFSSCIKRTKRILTGEFSAAFKQYKKPKNLGEVYIQHIGFYTKYFLAPSILLSLVNSIIFSLIAPSISVLPKAWTILQIVNYCLTGFIVVLIVVFFLIKKASPLKLISLALYSLVYSTIITLVCLRFIFSKKNTKFTITNKKFIQKEKSNLLKFSLLLVCFFTLIGGMISILLLTKLNLFFVIQCFLYISLFFLAFSYFYLLSSFKLKKDYDTLKKPVVKSIWN